MKNAPVRGGMGAAGLSELVSGFGITGRWTGVVRDNGGGVAPWSLDFGVDVSTPAGVTRSSPSPWFGDFTIADYPVADAFDGFGGIDPTVTGRSRSIRATARRGSRGCAT
jgi:hypothetical protein